MKKGRIKLLLTFIKGTWGKITGSVISVILAVAFRFVSPIIIAVTLDSVLGSEPLDLPQFLVDAINGVGGTQMLAQNIWICGLALVAAMAIRSVFPFHEREMDSDSEREYGHEYQKQAL